MNIYSVPMLISGILCTLLSSITWLFRRRETINRVFSFFTLTLAIDSFAFFMWFQFGSVENINTWMRFTFSAGFIVPIGLVLFFFAFTGYDKRMSEKVLGIRVRHFQIFTILFIILCMFLAQFTDLILDISDAPEHIWDVEFGIIGDSLFSFFGVLFLYLFIMVYKSYKAAENESRKRFILLLTAGTVIWLVFGYTAAIIFPTSSQLWHASNYIGTTMMAIFYFAAILNFQSDKVHELNQNLERKVVDRTQELTQKNLELEDTLTKLKHMQKQIIVQEKMATLGQLVAGLTHEINTPISAIRSMNDTKSKAAVKLQTALETIAPETAGKNHEIRKGMDVILKADELIYQGTERLNEIIINLKNFARLDEAETIIADIHEGIDSVLALIKHDMLTDIEVVREYSEIPPFVCNPRKLNQVFFNLLKNASQAIEDKGQITITTSLELNNVTVAIRDTGKGIEPGKLKSIFDPGFTEKGSVIRASLGLSICSQIIQEHNGEINVECQPGKGSVFSVSLPTEFNDK